MFFIKLQEKIETPLLKREVIQRLLEFTNVSNKDKEIFVGQIGDGQFKIHKKPKENVRNAFAPVFVGEIVEDSEGCHIYLTARLNLSVAIFFFIWSLATVVMPLIIGFVVPAFFLCSLICATFLILSIYFAFYKPAKKTVATIKSIINS